MRTVITIFCTVCMYIVAFRVFPVSTELAMLPLFAGTMGVGLLYSQFLGWLKERGRRCAFCPALAVTRQFRRVGYAGTSVMVDLCGECARES